MDLGSACPYRVGLFRNLWSRFDGAPAPHLRGGGRYSRSTIVEVVPKPFRIQRCCGQYPPEQFRKKKICMIPALSTGVSNMGAPPEIETDCARACVRAAQQCRVPGMIQSLSNLLVFSRSARDAAARRLEARSSNRAGMSATADTS